MSVSTEYTLYRRDSRDAITLDAASPVASLEALMEKARAEMEDALTDVKLTSQRYESAKHRHDLAIERVERFRSALEALAGTEVRSHPTNSETGEA